MKKLIFIFLLFVGLTPSVLGQYTASVRFGTGAPAYTPSSVKKESFVYYDNSGKRFYTYNFTTNKWEMESLEYSNGTPSNTLDPSVKFVIDTSLSTSRIFLRKNGAFSVLSTGGGGGPATVVTAPTILGDGGSGTPLRVDTSSTGKIGTKQDIAVVSASATEITTLAIFPNTDFAKNGNLGNVYNATDSVDVRMVKAGNFEVLKFKSSTIYPAYFTQSGKIFDFTKAEWTNTANSDNLVYKMSASSKKWSLMPDQKASLTNFPDATLTSIDLRKANIISTSDSGEYVIKPINGTAVMRWHRVSPIKVYTATMPIDSVLAGSQYVYNLGCDVDRYGVNTNNPNVATRYVSTNSGGWQPVKGVLDAIDFGILTATTNKQRRVSLQTMADSAIVSSGIKQGFIQCNIPQGDFTLDSTLHLGYGNAFNQLILRGAGRSYRGQGFTGTVLRVATSDQQIIDIAGARGTIVEQMTLVGLNDYAVPTGTNRSNIANYVKAGLHANANSRYAPHAGITLDGYSIGFGVPRPTPSYPDIRFLPYTGLTPSQTYTFAGNGSGVIIRNVMFFNLIVGVVNQPSGSDGNGDFTKIDNCQFDNCTYDVSVCQTQARNTIISNCEGYGEHTCFVTATHGKQNGRINVIANFSGGGCYQAFNIPNLAVNTTLYAEQFYSEDIQRIGTFGLGNSSSIIFNGGHLSFDERSTPQSGVVAHTLTATGLGTIIFNGLDIAGQKHIHFHNNQTKIVLNACLMGTNPLNGELSGVSATDTQRLGFRRAVKGVTASDLFNLEVNNCKPITDASLYAEDNNYFGNSRVYTNDNFNRVSIHDYKDFKPTLGILSNNIFNTEVAWARNQVNNLNCNYVGRRFAFGSNAAFVRQGWNKGDEWQTTDGLVFVCEDSRSDSLILTLMNNYTYNISTGAFTGYVNAIVGGSGSPLNGNLVWNSSRLFISPQPIYGFFTAGSQNVTGLKDQRGNAYNTSNIDLYTPLWGGQYNGLYPFTDYYNSVSYRINSSDLKMTDVALRTGWFPIGNTFNSRVYSFIDAERGLKSSATIPTIAGDIGDFVLNSTTGTTLLGWRNNGGTSWQPIYIIRTGSATLTAGTVTVVNSSITATSKIVLAVSNPGGTRGFLSYTLNAGVGFTINSNSALETSTVSYIITE